jgi:hypothetical protein
MAMKPRTVRRLAIGGASLAFHGLLGWALLNGVPATPVLIDPRSVVVELLSPTPQHPPEHAAAPRPSRAASRAPSPDAPSPHVLPSIAQPSTPGAPQAHVAPSSEIVAPPGFTARGSLTGGGEALRQAARKSACTEADVVKLTKAERDACAEALGEKNKNRPPMYAVIDPEKKAAFDGDCKKDDEWCLYRTGKGPYPGLFAIGKKKKIPGWD